MRSSSATGSSERLRAARPRTGGALRAGSLLSLFATVSLGCASGAPSETGRVERSVRYRLEWNAEGTTPLAHGGFELVTDRGDRVRVQRGYLTSYSAEVVECTRVADPQPLAAIATRLWTLLETPAAFASHSGVPNPAAMSVPRIESFAPGRSSVETEALPLGPARYCRAHYLIARATKQAVGKPADLDMVGASLHLDANVLPARGGVPIELRVHTAIANGLLSELYPPGRFGREGAAFELDGGASDTVVVVRRHLGRLFDGIDFASTAPRAVENQLLKNLIAGTEIEVERLP